MDTFPVKGVAGEATRFGWDGPPAVQAITARIGDGVWHADASVQAAVRDGILAVAGCDSAGRRIGLAVLTQKVGRPQLIGVTPANALICVGTSIWLANHGGGTGTITLLTLTASRATGVFDFVGVSLLRSVEVECEQRVAEGTFDVRLR